MRFLSFSQSLALYLTYHCLQSPTLVWAGFHESFLDNPLNYVALREREDQNLQVSPLGLGYRSYSESSKTFDQAKGGYSAPPVSEGKNVF